MLDKEQPTPEANGDPEPVLELPDDLPESRIRTKAMDGMRIDLGARVQDEPEIPTDFDDTEKSREEDPSPDEQPSSD